MAHLDGLHVHVVQCVLLNHVLQFKCFDGSLRQTGKEGEVDGREGEADREGEGGQYSCGTSRARARCGALTSSSVLVLTVAARLASIFSACFLDAFFSADRA